MHNLTSMFGFFTNTINKVIISRPKDKGYQYKKITITQKNNDYFIEQFTAKQAFHKTLSFDMTKTFCIDEIFNNFNQLNAYDNNFEYTILVSKKGKVSFLKKKLQANPSNNTSAGSGSGKNYILKEGTAIPPLVDMGIFTKDGKVVNSMYDKFKQINRFVELVDDVITDSITTLNIIDFGCGKSYLTFILYYYLTEIKNIKANIIGIDLKEEVINKCNEAAKKYKYDGLSFELGDINGYKTPFDVDMVVSLHACDTATDYALYNAINWNAKIILSVPCCQHELNSQFKTDNFAILEEFGIVKERIAALMTDSIRGNMLIASGYKTNVMEFVELSHTPKNLLIRAVKRNIPIEKKQKALSDVQALMQEFSLKPTLHSLLDISLDK